MKYHFKTLDKECRWFYYSPERKGWAKRYLVEQASEKELTALFYNRNRREYYDLIDITDSGDLIDAWFKKLLDKAVVNIERYI